MTEWLRHFIFYPDSSNFLHISNKALSLAYRSCVHWGSTFNFLQELFLCIHSLANWCKRPSFQAISASDMPFSLSLIISSVWFKMRDVWLFLTLEHLEAIIGLLTGMISILLCLREWCGPRRGREMGEELVSGAGRTHTSLYMVMVPGAPNNYNSNITDQGSQITLTDIIKWNSLKHTENYQNVAQRHKVSKFCWKNGVGRQSCQEPSVWTNHSPCKVQ